MDGEVSYVIDSTGDRAAFMFGWYSDTLWANRR